MKLYKILAPDGLPINGGSGKWSLPVNGKPGAWMPKVKTVTKCESGYHLCQAKDMLAWISTDSVAVYEAEGRGSKDIGDDKIAFAEARLLRLVGTLNARTLRHFAADCAEDVLENFEKKYPDDQRPRQTIQASRDFADGKITDSAASSAAWAADSAAYSAADSAAYSAAYSAADSAARSAYLAADSAAYSAARSAYLAADSAARSALRKKQLKRLFAYLKASLA